MTSAGLQYMNPPKSRWKKNNYWLVFFVPPVFSLFYLRLPHVSHCFNFAICFSLFRLRIQSTFWCHLGSFGDTPWLRSSDLLGVLQMYLVMARTLMVGRCGSMAGSTCRWFSSPGHLLMAVPKPVEKGPPEEKNESCYVRPAPSIRLRWFGFSTDSWVTVPKMCVFTKAISDWAMLRLQKNPKLDAWDSTIALYELISGGLRTSKDEMTVMLPSAQATSIDRRWLGRWIHWLDSWSIGWSDGFPTDSDVVCYSIKAFEPNDIDTRII